VRMEKTLRRKYLAAVIAAVSGPEASAGTTPWLADGDRIEVGEGTWETRDDSVVGLWARNAGIAIGNGVNLDTYGKSSHAVQANDASKITLTGGILHTRGGSAHGLYVERAALADVRLTDVSIKTEGGGSHGVSLGAGNVLATIKGGTIATHGYGGHGVTAENAGNIKIDGTVISTREKSAHGVQVRGGTTLDVRDATIDTLLGGSHGVLVSEGATTTLTNTKVRTQGTLAYALMTGGSNTSATFFGGSLLTDGIDAVAIYGSNGVYVGLQGTTVATTGLRAAGVDNRAGLIDLTDVTLSTTGSSAYGLSSKGGDIPGSKPVIRTERTAVVTEGRNAWGAHAKDSGRVELTNSSIRTTGDLAHGLMVDGGTVTTTDTTIETDGRVAYGAIVQAGGNLDMYGGSITSQQAAGLGLHDPGKIQIGGGAIIAGGDAAFAEVDPLSTKSFTVTLDGGSQAIGDIRLSASTNPPPTDETKASLLLKNKAAWHGATSIVRDLSLESGSTWTVTGDSHIGSLASNRGVVAFAPTAPNTFATVTVAGNYEGNGGLLRMRSQLGDDSSPGDLLHVMGDTSGDTRIAVDALDGAGGQTQEGIQLVRVDGASHGDFDLAGRAVAGAYEYFLHKGSISAPDDGGWYLRSTREPDPIVEPETGTPEPEGGFVDIPEPETAPEPVVGERLLRPEVGTYRANQTAALEMFQGGPGAGEDEERTGARQHVWARFDRRHTAFNAGSQLTTTSSTSELTIGADLFHDPDTDAHVGIMASTGRADTRGTSNLTHYSARGRVRGSAGGIYGGFRADVGTYLRGWAQYGHFNQRVEGDALRPERYGTGVLTASLEGGHRWRHALTRDTDTYIEPQAEILMSRLRGGKHIEANGTHVAAQNANGATARLGVRTAARWNTPNGHVASPYFAANWLRRLGRLDATTFSQEAFTAGVPRNSYALKLGVALLRSTGWSAWTDVETRFGAQRYRRVTGSIGIRKSW